MLARTHAVSGAAAGLAVGLLGDGLAVTLLCGAAGLVCSYVPDLDHPRARAVRALGPLGWLLCRGIRGLSAAVGLSKHRGLSHSLAFVALVGVAFGVAAAVWSPLLSPWLVGGAAAAGVCGALAGDWATKASLPGALWPLRVALPGPPRGLRVRTGSSVEHLLVFPVVAAGCVALTYVALIS